MISRDGSRTGESPAVRTVVQAPDPDTADNACVALGYPTGRRTLNQLGYVAAPADFHLCSTF